MIKDKAVVVTHGSVPVKRKYVNEQGIALNLLDWGGEGMVTALLIHGTADGAFVWNEFAPSLAAYCKVLAVDLRGHGESDHDPRGHYSLDKHVRDLADLLDNLQIDELILVGHSLGGKIATKIAPHLEKILRALVIVDSGPGGDPDTARYLQDQLRQGHRLYDRVEDYTKWLEDRRPLARPEVLERLAVASLAPVSHGYTLRFDLAVLDMITSDEDQSWWFPSLRRIKAPILIVRGLASASLSKQTAEQMRAAARNSRLATVPASGHAVMQDNIEGFTEVVILFLASAILQMKSA